MYIDAVNEYTKAIKTSLEPEQSLIFGTTEFNFIPYKASYYSIPVDIALYNNRALCYLRLKNFEEAINDCSSSLSIIQENPKALWRRAEAYYGLNKFNNSIEDLNKLKDMLENIDNKKRYSIFDI